MPLLTAQAEEILAQAKRLDAYMLSNNLRPPSFEHDSLVDLPPEYEAVRCALVDSTHNLKRLAQGTGGATTEMLFSFTDVTTLRVIHRYRISHVVPLQGSTTFEEIAQQVSLPSPLVGRFLRHAMASRVFMEPVPGRVSHTAISRALVLDQELFDAVGLLSDEFAPASNALVAAIDTYLDSPEPTHTGYNLANNTPLPIYGFLSQHPERMRRFGGGMQYFTRGEGWHLKHLRAGYDWGSVDRPGGLIVDIGGGHGAVSQYLAASTQHIRFVVQDLKEVAREGAATLPVELQERVEFMPHNFFSQQPVTGADVYFMRWILHNWSDKYCMQILRSLTPAMKKGSRVVLYEFSLPDQSVTSLTQKQGLNLDMVVLSCFNSRERTAKDWQTLFENADEQFRFEDVITPEGSSMSLVMATWV